MMITLYGIPNCDTVKKARVWLAAQQRDVLFHDVKKQRLERSTITNWLDHLNWDVLVNRKGSTWRGLPERRRAAILDAPSALELMLEFPSVIKRPVLDYGGQFHVGFSDALYRQIFNSLDETP